MTLIEFLVYLGIAAICGAIGQQLAGVKRGGCLVAIVLGFVGAFFGVWIANQFGLPELLVITIDGKGFPIVWSIVGAALLVAILSLFTRGGKKA